MKSYMTFNPDLVVEATSVCDRKCVGCYAPNVVSNQDTNALFQKRPELFLQKDRLVQTLSTIFALEGRVPTASIRGGEPTKHPLLPSLISTLCLFTDKVYLETHGQWILSDSEETQSLIDLCRENRVTLKISFDQMHGLSPEKLLAIAHKLIGERVYFVAAITEPSLGEFLNSRLRCDWLEDSRIIFQRKVSSANDLIQPKLGVIRPTGFLSRRLTAKSVFGSKQKEVAV